MKNVSMIGNDCVGCRSCELVCPVGAILMKQSEEGFLYPQVQKDTCIECGLCLRKCAQSYKTERQGPLEIYALKNKDSQRVQRSASAGASDIAANIVLEHDGVVFGAAYGERFYVEHVMVTDKSDLGRLQSSKYVQSDLRKTFLEAKQQLDAGRQVLFTGTPCQIDSLHTYLGKEYDNLYTIDLICHGVPSPKLFEAYMAHLEQKMGGEIVEFNFRSKEKRGWGTQQVVRTRTKTRSKSLQLERYGKHFMGGDCYRECCYTCKYANTNRVGDLTIGDFWAINKFHPEFYSSDGVSVVFVNSKKGQELFEQIKRQAEVLTSRMEAALSGQGNLVRPTRRPAARDFFYKGIDEPGYIESLKVGLQMQERIKAALPRALFLKLKQIFG